MVKKGGYRSYVDVDTIPSDTAVSTGKCAALVEHYTRVGRAVNWREGDAVRGCLTIKRGTAIATFVNGIYPNAEHGNHAALYVSQDSNGIKVVDQWPGRPPGVRVMGFLGAKDGAWIDPSNNGDAMSIIELD